MDKVRDRPGFWAQESNAAQEESASPQPSWPLDSRKTVLELLPGLWRSCTDVGAPSPPQNLQHRLLGVVGPLTSAPHCATGKPPHSFVTTAQPVSPGIAWSGYSRQRTPEGSLSCSTFKYSLFLITALGIKDQSKRFPEIPAANANTRQWGNFHTSGQHSRAREPVIIPLCHSYQSSFFPLFFFFFLTRQLNHNEDPFFCCCFLKSGKLTG